MMQFFRKFKNTKVEVDGIKFDSKLESNVYNELKSRNYQIYLQPKYELQEKFRYGKRIIRPIDYIGDFDVIINGMLYTIDAKGMETPVFKLKAKMFLYKYKREIIVIKSVKALKEWLERMEENAN